MTISDGLGATARQRHVFASQPPRVKRTWDDVEGDVDVDCGQLLVFFVFVIFRRLVHAAYNVAQTSLYCLVEHVYC